MSAITPKGLGTKIGLRLRQYQRRERLSLWVGGAFAGVITVYSAITISPQHPVPAALQILVPTLVLLGTVFLAYARVNFEWQAELLERDLEEDPNLTKTSDLPADRMEYPELAELAYDLELLVAVASAICVILVASFAAT